LVSDGARPRRLEVEVLGGHAGDHRTEAVAERLGESCLVGRDAVKGVGHVREHPAVTSARQEETAIGRCPFDAAAPPRVKTIEEWNPRSEVDMNTTLLVLRVVPGILLMGHGLQKLVPRRYSPPLLHARGPRATAGGFEQLGIQPGIAAAVLAGTAELVGGFSLAAGLFTPVGTILVGGVMTTAILTANGRNGIWNAEGGFEFPLLLLAVGFVITSLGAGSYSIDGWAGVDNWAGIHWSISPVARAAVALAIGVAGGLVPLIAVWNANSTSSRVGAQAGDVSRAQ
jgi:putative oxidoreductase